MTLILKSLFISILVINLYLCFDLITQFILCSYDFTLTEYILFTSFIPTTVNFLNSDNEPKNHKSSPKLTVSLEFEICEDYLLDLLKDQFIYDNEIHQ